VSCEDVGLTVGAGRRNDDFNLCHDQALRAADTDYHPGDHVTKDLVLNHVDRVQSHWLATRLYEAHCNSTMPRPQHVGRDFNTSRKIGWIADFPGACTVPAEIL
jgi:hypothetical protein